MVLEIEGQLGFLIGFFGNDVLGSFNGFWNLHNFNGVIKNFDPVDLKFGDLKKNELLFSQLLLFSIKCK